MHHLLTNNLALIALISTSNIQLHQRGHELKMHQHSFSQISFGRFVNATRFALMPDVFTLSTVLPTEIKLAYKLSSNLPGWALYSDGKENWKVLTLYKNIRPCVVIVLIQ